MSSQDFIDMAIDVSNFLATGFLLRLLWEAILGNLQFPEYIMLFHPQCCIIHCSLSSMTSLRIVREEMLASFVRESQQVIMEKTRHSRQFFP